MSGEEEEEWNVKRYVCAGIVPLDNVGTDFVYAMHEVTGRTYDDNAILCSIKSKWAIKPVPGMIYTMQQKDSSYRPGSLAMVDQWHDQNKRAEWQARSRAHALLQEERKRTKKLADQDDLLSVMAPIRAAYKKTNWSGKRHLEVLILDYLRR